MAEHKVMLALALLGYGAALLTLWSVYHEPHKAVNWAQLIVGLPLGSLCGTFLLSGCAHCFTQLLPTWLEAAGAKLHVRINFCWGLRPILRRGDAAMPIDEIKGVEFRLNPQPVQQGGLWDLVILHRSGMAFITGWSCLGPKPDTAATGFAESLAQWLDRAKECAPPRP